MRVRLTTSRMLVTEIEITCSKYGLPKHQVPKHSYVKVHLFNHKEIPFGIVAVDAVFESRNQAGFYRVFLKSGRIGR